MTTRTMECFLVLYCCLCIFGAYGTPNGKEIEARRRSALDKNFMRFGRNYPNTHMLLHLDNSKGLVGRELTKRNANKETRTTKTGNMMRFGRANNNFLRFGRNQGLFNLIPNDEDAILIPQIKRGNSFLRFGRQYAPLPASSADIFVPAEAVWPPMQMQAGLGQPEEFDDADVSDSEDFN